MFHQKLKELYYSAVSNVVSNISNFTLNPHSDFTRSRKLPAHLLISFLVSQGASSTGVELLDFFDFSGAIPTVSALNQQRSTLKPQALEAVLKQYNSCPLMLIRHHPIVFWLRMALPLHSLAILLLLLPIIMSLKDILQKAFITCI